MGEIKKTQLSMPAFTPKDYNTLYKMITSTEFTNKILEKLVSEKRNFVECYMENRPFSSFLQKLKGDMFEVLFLCPFDLEGDLMDSTPSWMERVLNKSISFSTQNTLNS